MTVLFGTLFNNIKISREDNNSTEIQRLKVPIIHEPRDKMISRITADPNIDREHAIILPCMSFQLMSMQYDPQRKLMTTPKIMNRKTGDNTNTERYAFNPVPYNFLFKLLIYTKTFSDSTKIIEQILPYFTPDWTQRVELIPEMNIDHDISIVLENISIDDNYTQDFKQRNQLVWELDFVVKGYLYGPTQEKKIIKFVDLDYKFPDPNKIIQNIPISEQKNNYVAVVNTIIQPGLMANGQPTSNLSLSVSANTIDSTSNYAYIVRITDIDIP